MGGAVAQRSGEGPLGDVAAEGRLEVQRRTMTTTLAMAIAMAPDDNDGLMIGDGRWRAVAWET